MSNVNMMSSTPRDGCVRRWFEADGWQLAIDILVEQEDVHSEPVLAFHDAIALDEHAELLHAVALYRGHDVDWKPVPEAATVAPISHTVYLHDNPDLRLGLSSALSKNVDAQRLSAVDCVRVRFIAHARSFRFELLPIVLSCDECEKLRQPDALLLLRSVMGNSLSGYLVEQAGTAEPEISTSLRVLVDPIKRELHMLVGDEHGRVQQAQVVDNQGVASECHVVFDTAMVLNINHEGHLPDPSQTLPATFLDTHAIYLTAQIKRQDEAVLTLSGELTTIGSAYAMRVLSSEPASGS